MQETWQREWGESLRTAKDLEAWGFIDHSDVGAYELLLKKYKFVLPRYYAGLIEVENADCPIRAQAIPKLCESEATSWLLTDPLGDLNHRPASRITHRYRNRLLVNPTSNCSMYCRYCFRKSLLNELSEDFFSGSIKEAFEYIHQHEEIDEVILSGGDPLMLADKELWKLTQALDGVPHLKRIRYHSRVPVTFPSRITEALAQAISETGLSVILVSHFNHPKELTESSRHALTLLSNYGITLLNQSVLLKGVNNCSQILKDLSEGLFDWGILPYYLHHPDRAIGTEHFEISEQEGREIIDQVKQVLPGYLVPRYVVDDQRLPFKSLLA